MLRNSNSSASSIHHSISGIWCLHLITSDFQIFRYCKIDAAKQAGRNSSPDEDGEQEMLRNAVRFAPLDIKLHSLQMIKLDLCYADLNLVVRRILPFTG